MNGFVKMGIVMGLLGALQTGKVSRPEVPKNLEAPVGEEVLLWAHAKGVQIYACQAGADQKPAWVLKGPEAELTDAAGKTIAHHFAGPTWKHADGSKVTGKKVKEQDAPKANAIPWLLLTAASHTGEGVFRRVTSIQRIRTQGGLAPEANTCDSSANGKEARMAYEADYYFYVPTASTEESGTGSKVWVGRYAEYEEFLRTAVVDRTINTGTAQRIFFKPGGLAASAALKAHASKLETAGYELDRVLELDMVPPTVQARYKGEMTGLQLWVLNCTELKELNEQNLHAPDPVKWAYQLNRLHAFEDLVANLDKKEGSPLVDPQWNLIVLDHSLAFTNTLAQPYVIGKNLNQIDRPFFDRIKALDKPTVQRAIGDLVDAGALDALFTRRDNIVKGFEKLAAEKGANQVFTP